MNSHRNSIILLRGVFLTFYFLSLPAIKLLILEFAYWLNVNKIYAQDWFILQLISQTTTFFSLIIMVLCINLKLIIFGFL